MPGWRELFHLQEVIAVWGVDYSTGASGDMARTRLLTLIKGVDPAGLACSLLLIGPLGSGCSWCSWPLIGSFFNSVAELILATDWFIFNSVAELILAADWFIFCRLTQLILTPDWFIGSRLTRLFLACDWLVCGRLTWSPCESVGSVCCAVPSALPGGVGDERSGRLNPVTGFASWVGVKVVCVGRLSKS